MKGGRKGKLSIQAVTSGGKTQRSLGGDMDRFGVEGFKALEQFAFGAQGEANFGVGRTRPIAELIRGKGLYLVAQFSEPFCNGSEGCHDAIDLGLPGIGNESDFHSVFPQSLSNRSSAWHGMDGVFSHVRESGLGIRRGILS